MSARVAIPWTVEDRDELARRYESGEPMAQIAKALKRSHGACAWQAHLLGLRRSNVAAGANVAWSAEEDAALMAMLEQGQTMKQAAERLGRPWRGVANRLTRLRTGKGGQGFGGRPKGLPQGAKHAAFGEPGGPWTPAEEARLMELAEAGAAWPVISQALGRSPQACKARRYVLSLEATSAKAKAAPVDDNGPPWVPPERRPRNPEAWNAWERANGRLCAIAHPGLRAAYGRRLTAEAKRVAYPVRAEGRGPRAVEGAR
jgi:hypothetical protein